MNYALALCSLPRRTPQRIARSHAALILRPP